MDPRMLLLNYMHFLTLGLLFLEVMQLMRMLILLIQVKHILLLMGVDIKQTSYYIEMSCQNYIHRLCKSHGWELNKDLNKVQPIIESSSMD